MGKHAKQGAGGGQTTEWDSREQVAVWRRYSDLTGRLQNQAFSDIRDRLGGKLDGLGLTARERQIARRKLRPVASEDLFWRTLESLDAVPKEILVRMYAQSMLRITYGIERRGALPASCIDACTAALDVVEKVRRRALERREKWSADLRRQWFEENDGDALVQMVRADGVATTWVSDAIAELRWQSVFGEPNEQEAARKLLRRVGDAVAYVGGLNRKRHRSEADIERVRATKDAAANRSAKVTRLVQLYRRHRREMSRERAVQATLDDFDARAATKRATAAERGRIKRKLRERLRLER